MEAGVLFDYHGRPLFWHLPSGRTAGSLPDSSDLWSEIWKHREEVCGFAHTHPGSGVPGPSETDLTTFAAIEAALGRRLLWPILNDDASVMLRWVGPGRLDYDCWLSSNTPSYRNRNELFDELRRLSKQEERS